MTYSIPFALTLGLACTACATQPAAPAFGPGASTGPVAGPVSQPLAGPPGTAVAPGSTDQSTDQSSDPPGASVSPVSTSGPPTSGAQPTPAPIPPEPGAVPSPPPGPPPLDPVDCASARERGQLALSADQYELRTGKDARALNDLHSSRERPVEVCGVHDQHALLMTLTCADGSRPLARSADARRARQGSVGAGGRCGKFVDLYRVTCPEKRYDVYMDAYFCRADQSLDRRNSPPEPTPGADDAAEPAADGPVERQ